MKNKRLFIILSVFAFLVLIAVLCSTVFTVKTVKINWIATKIGIDESDETLIGDIEKGGSVCLVDKESIIESLEQNMHILKLIQ